MGIIQDDAYDAIMLLRLLSCGPVPCAQRVALAMRMSSTRTFFTPTAPHGIKQMPPRPTVNEADITEAFLKGSGPGGQKIVGGCHSPKSLHG